MCPPGRGRQRTNPQPVGFTVTLRAAAPRLAYYIYFFIYILLLTCVNIFKTCELKRITVRVNDFNNIKSSFNMKYKYFLLICALEPGAVPVSCDPSGDFRGLQYKQSSPVFELNMANQKQYFLQINYKQCRH